MLVIYPSALLTCKQLLAAVLKTAVALNRALQEEIFADLLCHIFVLQFVDWSGDEEQTRTIDISNKDNDYIIWPLYCFEMDKNKNDENKLANRQL